MSLGYIAIAALTPLEMAAAYTINPMSAVMLIRWLGGTRHTEDLVQGVSFPGYDAQGNPIDAEEVYQYADIVASTGIEHATVSRLIEGGAPMIAAKDASGTNIVFTTARELIDALTREAAWPYHTDGTPYSVQWNGTDFIMDGKPAQDYFGPATGIVDAISNIPWYVWLGVAYLGYRAVKG